VNSDGGLQKILIPGKASNQRMDFAAHALNMADSWVSWILTLSGNRSAAKIVFT